jgi:phosphate transport system substrate-binding protein
MPNKNLVIIATVVIVAAVAIALLAMQPGGSSQHTTSAACLSTPTATPTPTPTTPPPTRLSGALTGGGSTFVAPQMFAWSRTFHRVTGGRSRLTTSP